MLSLQPRVYNCKFQNLFTYENKKIKTSKLKTLKGQDPKASGSKYNGNNCPLKFENTLPISGGFISSLLCSVPLAQVQGANSSTKIKEDDF